MNKNHYFLFIVKNISCVQFSSCHTSNEKSLALNFSQTTVYVNNLPNHIQNFLGLFTDNTKIYCTITSSTDVDLLQQDLHSLLDWCGIWLISLNFTNCKH